jgi:hypothetical protein
MPVAWIQRLYMPKQGCVSRLSQITDVLKLLAIGWGGWESKINVIVFSIFQIVDPFFNIPLDYVHFIGVNKMLHGQERREAFIGRFGIV